MAEETIVCMSCAKEFVYTQREQLFLEDLKKQGKIPEVIAPKKCVPCRSSFRRSRRQVPVRHEVQPESKTARYADSLGTPKGWTQPATSALASTAIPHQVGCMCHRCGDQSMGRQKGMPDVVITPLPPLPDIVILHHPPVPAPIPASAPAPGAPTAEEIVILVASDFEKLVCREDVVWRQGNRKITIRLADIGPGALKKAMEAAVLHWWKS